MNWKRENSLSLFLARRDRTLSVTIRTTSARNYRLDGFCQFNHCLILLTNVKGSTGYNFARGIIKQSLDNVAAYEPSASRDYNIQMNITSKNWVLEIRKVSTHMSMV